MKKKTLLIALCLLATVGMIKADTETEISSEDKAIGYKGIEGYFINGTQFSTYSAVAGNIVRIEGTLTATDHKCWVGEWAENDDVATVHLPGSEYRNVPKVNDGEDYSFTYDIYLTEDMLNKIVNEKKDFRIYGEGMTITSAKLVQPGKAGALKFGKTIWTGYFWMVDKGSLEIFKEAFTVMSNEEFAKYGIMRIYYEANRSDFLMRLFTKFGTPGADDYIDETSIKLAGSELDDHMGEHADEVTPKKIYLHDTYVDVPLTDTIKTYLKTNNDEKGRSLFIKCNLINGVAPFNVTDVVLLPISPDGCDNCFYVY